MKTFVLTQEFHHEGAMPVLVVLARTRELAILRIHATDDPRNIPGLSSRVIIPDELKERLNIYDADSYSLYEVSSIS